MQQYVDTSVGQRWLLETLFAQAKLLLLNDGKVKQENVVSMKDINRAVLKHWQHIQQVNTVLM